MFSTQQHQKVPTVENFGPWMIHVHDTLLQKNFTHRVQPGEGIFFKLVQEKDAIYKVNNGVGCQLECPIVGTIPIDIFNKYHKGLLEYMRDKSLYKHVFRSGCSDSIRRELRKGEPRRSVPKMEFDLVSKWLTPRLEIDGVIFTESEDPDLGTIYTMVGTVVRTTLRK